MKTQVHAHRANTLPRFDSAARIGAHAVEIDLVIVGQEVLVSHDPIPERAEVPSLDDVLRLARLRDFAYDLEIKTWPGCPPPDELARLVLDRIRAHKLETRVAVLSFSFPVLRAMRALAPEISLSALIEADPRSFVEVARVAAAAEIVSPEFHLVTPAKVAEAHTVGLQVVPWTVNERSDWGRMLAANVDGIITDDPAALLAYLNE